MNYTLCVGDSRYELNVINLLLAELNMPLNSYAYVTIYI